jgi:hypothetical protein
MSEHLIVGLDLGQTTDFSAACIVRRIAAPHDPTRPEPSIRHYEVAALRRWPLHTPYTTVVADLAKALQAPAYRDANLVVDQTGVGRPVVEMIRRAGLGCRVVPITITAGTKVTQDGGEYHVPKLVLGTNLLMLLEQRRIFVANTLPEGPVLARELQGFSVKVTPAANETLGARGGQHDDLVMSVMLACWWGECGFRQVVMFIR